MEQRQEYWDEEDKEGRKGRDYIGKPVQGGSFRDGTVHDAFVVNGQLYFNILFPDGEGVFDVTIEATSLAEGG